MRDLLAYARVIYDANCIVFLSFIVEEENAGRQVPIFGRNSQKAQRITVRLVEAGKSVVTLRDAWAEAERALIDSALPEAIHDGRIHQALGLAGKISRSLELRLAQKLKAKLSGLRRESWFSIDAIYRPSDQKAQRIKDKYREFCLDPILQRRIPGGKGDPSNVDVSLILYSGDSGFPLLTDDRELYSFSEELKADGLCTLIKAFQSVTFEHA